MKKVGILLLAVLIVMVLALAGCGGAKETSSPAKPAAPAQEESILSLLDRGRQVPGMTYDTVTTSKNFNSQGTVWFEKGKMRQEMSVQGRKMTMIYDGDTMYQYDPITKTGMKFNVKEMQALAGQTRKPDSPANYDEYMNKDTLKVVENAVLDGVKCKVTTYTTKDNKSQVKMWVREDYGVPMRQEITTGEDKIVTEYKNMKIGALPADTFKLPDGITFRDMSEMMKNIPQKP